MRSEQAQPGVSPGQQFSNEQDDVVSRPCNPRAGSARASVRHRFSRSPAAIDATHNETEATISNSSGSSSALEGINDQTEQDFGKDPVEVRESDHYQQEYVEGFVDKWDELIDWDARYESEGDFFIKMLKERGAKRILDVATGTGFHSVRLIEAGFEVCSVDGSAAMLAKAFENGRNRGHILRTIQADWRWLNQDVHAAYDAVICLGNSFNHLFDERDRRKALAEFYAVLKHDGCLILDQRNYDSILDDGFSTKHKFYYCGHQVSAEPEYVDEGLARFRYTFPDDSVYYLNMCPIRRDYVRGLMQEVGFQKISTYADFEDEESTGTADFYIHVAEKKYYGAEDIQEDESLTAGEIEKP